VIKGDTFSKGVTSAS